MHIAIWTIAALTLGLWSLLAWAVFALLGMDPTWIGNLQPWVAEIPFIDIVEAWVPGWQSLLVSLLLFVQAMVGWLGSAGTVVVWAVYGAGALFIIATAAVLSAVVALVRKTEAKPPATAQPAAA